MEIVSVEEIRHQVERYLNGAFELDEFVDWIEMHERDAFAQWRLDHPGETERVLPEIPETASDMLACIEMMDTEMVCSGSFRTEEMFRTDLRSLLDGEPRTAFELDWDKYMAWCRQREADIERLCAPWYSKFFRRVPKLLGLR